MSNAQTGNLQSGSSLRGEIDAEIINYQYIGWIPCISGRLNYNFFWAGQGENRLDINIRRSQTRLIIISSSVNWRDRSDKSYSGNSKIILLGKVDNETCFRGHAYLYQDDLKEKPEDIKKIESILNEIENTNKIKSNLESKTFTSGLSSVESSEVARLQTQIFTLAQDLEVNTNISKITCPQYYGCKILVLPGGVSFLSYIGHPSYASDDSRVVQSTICRQLFYYTKYALHQHKHHAHQDDCITTTYERPPTDQIGEILIQNLKKTVIHIKRRFDNTDYMDTTHEGILSYTRALTHTCMDMGFISDDSGQRRIKEIDNISSSFAALMKKRASKYEKNEKARSGARTFLSIIIAISALAVVFIFNTHNVTKLTPPTYVEYFTTRPFQAISAITLILFCLFWVLLAIEKNFYVGSKTIRVTFRKFLISFTNAVIWASVIAGIGSMLLTIYLAYSFFF